MPRFPLELDSTVVGLFAFFSAVGFSPFATTKLLVLRVCDVVCGCGVCRGWLHPVGYLMGFEP